MNASEILQSKKISPTTAALFISAEEAIQEMLEYAVRADIKLDLQLLDAEELRLLISSYGNCVVEFHPEDYHPVRAAILRNYQLLKRCGLRDPDLEIIDFT